MMLVKACEEKKGARLVPPTISIHGEIPFGDVVWINCFENERENTNVTNKVCMYASMHKIRHTQAFVPSIYTHA